MKKNILGLLGLIVLLVVGCTKSIDKVNTAAPVPAPLTSIIVERNFNWSSTKQFSLSVTGLSTVNTVAGTFSVIDLKTGATFYSGSHKLSDNLSLKLNIPTATDSLQIRFGSIKKNYSASGKSVQTDYLDNLTNE